MKILIVDEQPMIVSGCRSLFVSDPSVSVEGAGDAKAGFQAWLQLQPDVTIVEIKLPDATGFELMRQIREKDPAAKIIVFSLNEDPVSVMRAVETGARGYLSKSDDPRDFVHAVEKVAAGKNYISPQLAEAVIFSFAAIKVDPTGRMTTREHEVLSLLSRGDKVLDIANRLGISYKTAANITTQLKRKLNARNRSDLVRIAVEMNSAKAAP